MRLRSRSSSKNRVDRIIWFQRYQPKFRGKRVEHMNLIPVGILGTGKYVPERILTNQELETMVETNDEWIVTRTGMERRIAAEDQATSDLAIEARRIALRTQV